MENLIDKFKEKVRIESEYTKAYSIPVINSLIEYYDIEIEKKKYSADIQEDPVSIALTFYQIFFPEYYELIKSGIDNNEIIISQSINFSGTESKPLRTYIRLYNDDRDISIVIHELAHFIDLKLEPHIIHKKNSYYCEVVSFYIEKLFEETYKDSYKNLIKTRKNNRVYYEKKRLYAIKLMLEYEEHFKKYGTIDDIIDQEKIAQIMKFESNNTVNSLIRYPLGELFSSYMLLNDIKLHQNLQEVLKKINIYEILNDEKVRKMVLDNE